MDVAFTKARVAVFVDGCFWHGCPVHGVLPTANRAWWDQKIKVTKARDLDTADVLRSAGWMVLRFWEHEVPQDMAATVARTLDGKARH
jgi:DNA mismatch endonuclease (patch repair protein)